MQKLKQAETDPLSYTVGQIGLTAEGLGWAALLAQYDIKVLCSDPDEEIVNGILEDVLPGEMPGLSDYVHEGIQKGMLKCLGNPRRIFQNCRVIFINALTPLKDDNFPDLRFIETIVRQAAYQISDDTVLVLHTLLPEEAVMHLQKEADARLAEREENIKLKICLMPDFRITGNWLCQIKNILPLIVGCEGEMPETLHQILSLLPKANNRIKSCTIGEAALSGYGFNGLAVLQQTYMEEISHLALKNNILPQKMREILLSLPKALPDNTGSGYGGRLLPDRMQTLDAMAQLSDVHGDLFSAVVQNREDQTQALIDRLKEAILPEGKTLAVLGLAPFADTDDLRNTPAIEIVRAMIASGAEIRLFMPCGTDQAKWRFYKERDQISFCKTAAKALENADVVLILGKWRGMGRILSKSLPKKMRGDRIFDIVCGLNPHRVRQLGLKYYN